MSGFLRNPIASLRELVRQSGVFAITLRSHVKSARVELNHRCILRNGFTDRCLRHWAHAPLIVVDQLIIIFFHFSSSFLILCLLHPERFELSRDISHRNLSPKRLPLRHGCVHPTRFELAWSFLHRHLRPACIPFHHGCFKYGR